jgi:hypothetical protein
MALSMQNLNCEMFEIVIPFDEKQFNKNEFKVSRKCKDKSHKFFVSHHNSQSIRKKEHAHLAIILDKKESQLRAIFLEDRIEEGDDETPLSNVSLEDCVKEVSPFFKKDEFEAGLQAVFRFDKDFEPIIKIRYPLLVESKLLQNATISGHEIEFSNNSMTGKFLITVNEKGDITTLFNAKTKVVLTEFNPYDVIKQCVGNIKSLLRMKGKKDNEKNNN